MPRESRPFAFWFIMVFLALSIVLMVTGQTLSIVNYDLTVRLGLQESSGQVGEHGVQVNRAFGVGDTAVYIPLMMASLVGLWQKRRWSLLTTAAVFGISVHWTVTIASMLVFLPGVSGYSYVPGIEIWLFVGTYMIFGVVGFVYLACRG